MQLPLRHNPQRRGSRSIRQAHKKFAAIRPIRRICMRKKLICLLVAGSLPGMAMADTTSDQINALRAQLNALQKEVKQLRAEVATQPKTTTSASAATAVPAPAVAAAPVDISSPDYGRA